MVNKMQERRGGEKKKCAHSQSNRHTCPPVHTDTNTPTLKKKQLIPDSTDMKGKRDAVNIKRHRSPSVCFSSACL